MLEINTKAPSFNLPDEEGNMHTLEEYRGHRVILYFYPRPVFRSYHYVF